MAKKSKYQVIIGMGGGSKTFRYFDAEPQKAKSFAATLATESVYQLIRQQRPFSSFKTPRTINVVEFDNEKKCAKKDGVRFKLQKAYVEKTYIGGRKERKEWYEPVD